MYLSCVRKHIRGPDVDEDTGAARHVDQDVGEVA